MSQLSRNLNALRKARGLTVEQVQDALARKGIPVAYSTVAGWFNGNRGVGSMEHLKALAAILETDMNGLTGDEAEVTEGPLETMVIRDLRALSPEQKEAVLGVIRTMKGGK